MRAAGYAGQPGSLVRGERSPRGAHGARERAPVVVETDERVPAVDEVAERERDVDAVARADLRPFPREAVGEGRAVRGVRVEDGAAGNLHLGVADERARDLVGVVGAERAFVAGDDGVGRVLVDAEVPRDPAHGLVARWGRTRRVDEQAHLVGGRARDERDVGGRALRERGRRRGGNDVGVDHRMERHHADCPQQRAHRGRLRVDECVGGEVAQLARFTHARFLHHHFEDHRGARIVEGREGRAALDDGSGEQPGRGGRGEHV